MRYDKLVRDSIPEFIERRGGKAKFHVADIPEFEEKLNNKLLEEANELIGADPDSRAEEIADILEIIEAIEGHYGIDKERVEELKKKKLEERGGFSKRIILEES